MSGLIVVLVMVLALLGAVALAWVFRGWRRSPALGALLGALLAGAGSLVLVLPLGLCPFEAGASPLDRGFGFFLLALGALLGWGLAYWLAAIVWGDRAGSADPDMQLQGAFKAPWPAPWLLLAPTLLILIVFIYYPALDTFRLAAQNARLGNPRTQFVCVRNFTELIQPSYSPGAYALFAITALVWLGLSYAQRQHWTLTRLYGYGRKVGWGLAIASAYVFAMGLWSDYYRLIFFNTFLIATVTVVVGLALSLALATLVHQPIQGAGVYRTLLVWSYAISPAVAGVIFAIMFNPVAGVANHILETTLHMQRLPWLTDPTLARGVLITASIWKQLGYNILFYIAGLQTVPRDQIEAATLEGANRWQRFTNVVLPALSPITFFLIITNLTYVFFDIYGMIDYLTSGGPNSATSVAIYEIIRVGIRADRNLGRAAAQSIILFMMVIGVTLLQFRTSGRRVTYGS